MKFFDTFPMSSSRYPPIYSSFASSHSPAYEFLTFHLHIYRSNMDREDLNKKVALNAQTICCLCFPVLVVSQILSSKPVHEPFRQLKEFGAAIGVFGAGALPSLLLVFQKDPRKVVHKAHKAHGYRIQVLHLLPSYLYSQVDDDSCMMSWYWLAYSHVTVTNVALLGPTKLVQETEEVNAASCTFSCFVMICKRQLFPAVSYVVIGLYSVLLKLVDAPLSKYPIFKLDRPANKQGTILKR